MSPTKNQPTTISLSVRGQKRSNNAHPSPRLTENLDNLNRKGKLKSIKRRVHPE